MGFAVAIPLRVRVPLEALATSRSKTAQHMHTQVCICSKVGQFISRLTDNIKEPNPICLLIGQPSFTFVLFC